MSNSAPFFSIIVPACNVADYIAELIASVKAQTFTDFECICVVEESTDGTLALIQSLIADDRRFAVVSLPCTGSASVSRNYGIQNAAGQYIFFADGDDVLEETLLARSHAAVAEFGNLDIIGIAATVFHIGDNNEFKVEEVIKRNLPKNQILSGKKALEIILQNRFRSATWLQCYRRGLLVENELYQVPGRRHQDDEWTYRVFWAAQSIVYIGGVGYYYRHRSNSVTTTLNLRSIHDIAANIISFLEFYKTHYRQMSKDLRYGFCSWVNDFMSRFFRLKKYDIELRRQALKQIFAAGRWRIYLQMLWYAKLTFKLLAPCFLIARWHWGLVLAQTIYLNVFWRIIVWRGNVSKVNLRHT